MRSGATVVVAQLHFDRQGLYEKSDPAAAGSLFGVMKLASEAEATCTY